MKAPTADRTPDGVWIRRFPRLIPLGLFLIVMAATFVALMAIEQAAGDARRIDLERHAGEIGAALQRRAAESAASLHAAAALMATRDDANRQAFSRFAAALSGGGSYHSALGIGWAPLLAPAEVGAHERGQQALARGYAIRPRPGADTRLLAPVTYLEPMSAINHRALGFDMYSESVRRDAMDRAIAVHGPATSGRLHLVQDDGRPDARGFIVYMPVYDPDTQRVRGFVYSPFRAADFLAAASQLPSARNLEVAIYDGSLATENLLAERRLAGAGGVRLLKPLTIAERQWILEVADKSTAGLSVLSRFTLFFGVLLALAAMLLGRFVTRQAAADRAVLERLSSEAAIRTSLVRELNHRVKNTLANVLSIASLTRRRARGLDDFADALTGRIRALSATHDLLSQSDWSSAPIAGIVRSELAPYMAPGDDHVEISGPGIALAPNDAMSLGLALHELATNAAKYGALSAAGGKVRVTWRLMAPDLAEVQWTESGGPAVAAPAKRGFGRDLIEKIVASELNNAVDLRFEPGGVRCRLRVPVRQAGEFAIRQG